MHSWCRLCREWVYESHFLLPDGTQDGCGQGRRDIRYHPENPLCGDVWRLHDGQVLVVDYIDSLTIGFTFQNGKRHGINYRYTFKSLVRRGQLISSFEEIPFDECDNEGWSRLSDKGEVRTSIEFLKTVIELTGQLSGA